jgi:hemerythrin
MNPAPDRHILGLPEMDEQHNYLYSLFDRIEKAPQVSNQKAAKALLEEIERYVLFHFASEEQLMRLYGFPGFAAHQSDHESAGAKLVQFMDDFAAGRLNPGALRIFLTGWLMEHSRISDSEYVTWVKKRRDEVEAALKK